MADTDVFFVVTGVVSGALTTSSETAKVILPCDAELVSVYAKVGTAPTGAALIATPAKNGVDILANVDALSIAISASAGSLKITNPTAAGTNYIYTPFTADKVIGSFTAGDTISLAVSQVGSTIAGSDLSVSFLLRKK